MDIRNTTQFVNFIKKGGLENLDMNFLQLSQCVDKLAHACNCHRAERYLYECGQGSCPKIQE